MVIFTMLAVGLYTGGFWARAIAMENTRRLGSTVFANGVLKQIGSLDEDAMDDAADGGTVPIRISNIGDDGSYVTEQINLTLGSMNEVTVQVVTASEDEDFEKLSGGFRGEGLRMNLRPTVTRRELTSGVPANGFYYEVTVDFQYESAVPRKGGADNWSPAVPARLATVRTYVD